MNILTKIFVVLVAILSVALVALMVSFVARTENYKAQLDTEKTQRTTAEATARQQGSELDRLRASENTQIVNLKNETSGLRDQLNALTARLADAEARAQGEAARSAALNATIQGLTAANQQHGGMVNALQTELQQRRDTQVQLQTRTIELTDRVAELQNTNDTLIRQVRRQQEQIAQISEENSRLNEIIQRADPTLLAMTREPPAPGAGEGFSAAEPIHGQITELRRMEGSGFAQVNVGRRDGVQPNMKFWIFRGDQQFLGTLVVTTVDEGASAGRIILAERPIEPGDRVYSGPTRQ